MPASPKGLGRGLEALFAESSQPEGSKAEVQLQFLHVDSLQPNPDQPRKTIPEESLQELAQSIKAQGLLQPILACSQPKDSKYQIIAGERRWRACRLAGLTQVPVILSSLDSAQALLLGLIENLQREDLNPMEEAQAVSHLQHTLGLSQTELAQRLGKSRSVVANTLRLLHLEPEIQEALQNREISTGQARALLGVQDSSLRLALFTAAMQHALSVRELEKAAAHCRNQGCLPQNLASGSGPRTGKAKPEPDPEFKHYKRKLQREFSSLYPARVNIQGAREKGQIAFKYSSQQELRELLRKLGLPEELVSRETS
ncbi:MAG: ParB/RepB/Spo0J family partition protein [Desulfohalobiaceae bacterium]